jgi:hypothetical protein
MTRFDLRRVVWRGALLRIRIFAAGQARLEPKLKVFWRILIVNGLVVITIYALVFLPPSFAPWESIGVRDFLVRAGWILTMPLVLEIISYPIALRYLAGMARSKQ